MDPNANLIEQLQLAQFLIDDNSSDNNQEAERLAELVLALNDWITKGGFLPEQWRRQ